MFYLSRLHPSFLCLLAQLCIDLKRLAIFPPFLIFSLFQVHSLGPRNNILLTCLCFSILCECCNKPFIENGCFQTMPIPSPICPCQTNRSTEQRLRNLCTTPSEDAFDDKRESFSFQKTTTQLYMFNKLTIPLKHVAFFGELVLFEQF